jgi:hypothetical protein
MDEIFTRQQYNDGGIALSRIDARRMIFFRGLAGNASALRALQGAAGR